MARTFLMILVGVVVALMPRAVDACVYPTALRAVNNTLIGALDRGGEVKTQTRMRLARTLAGMSARTVIAALAPEIARRDLRAVRAVLAEATALAEGRGVVVDPAVQSDADRLKAAVQIACSDATQGANGTDPAKGIEHGGARKDGGTGRALSFQEGMVRLSVTFTIYLVFLGFLFMIRQAIHARHPPARGPARGIAPPDLGNARGPVSPVTERATP